MDSRSGLDLCTGITNFGPDTDQKNGFSRDYLNKDSQGYEPIIYGQNQLVGNFGDQLIGSQENELVGNFGDQLNGSQEIEPVGNFANQLIGNFADQLIGYRENQLIYRYPGVRYLEDEVSLHFEMKNNYFLF